MSKNAEIKITYLLLISVCIIILDQITKSLSNTSLDYNVITPVFAGLDWLLVYNSGAAFSFLSEAGGWQRWVFSGVSLVVSAVIFVWLIRLPKGQGLLGLALAIILGGALGNLYDRLVLGYVIDFISVYYGEYRFATFNIADSAVSIGAVLLALDIFKNSPMKREIKEEKARENSPLKETDVKKAD